MSRIGMLTFPAIRSGKNFVSNKRNTKHSRVRQKHSTRARGFREWNTKRKTRLETTSTESTVQPCPRQKRTKSKGALHKAMVFYVFTKKTPKKTTIQRVQPNSRCCSRSCWTDHCVSQLCTLQSKLHRRAYWGFNANWSRVAKPPCNLPLNFSYDIFFGQCMFGRLHPILRSLG